MSDNTPKLNVHRMVFHIGDDEEWRKLQASDFIAKSDNSIPMNNSLQEKEKRDAMWLDDSDLRAADATSFGEFDVKKVVEDAILSSHEVDSKKTWKDKGLAFLLEKANSNPLDDLTSDL